MDCTEARAALHAHLDRELDPVVSATVDAHLESCAKCARTFERLTSLRTAIKQHATYYRAPDALADRIRSKTGGSRKPAEVRAPRGWWLPLGTAIAATAVLTWVTAIQMEGLSVDEKIAAQVIVGHSRAVLTEHLTDVTSSDQHTVKPWLSSKLDFSPPVTDLAAAGYPLIGGRLDYLDHRTVAALVYRHRQHVINVFVWPDEKSGTAESRPIVSKQGYNLLNWTGSGMNYWAISDLNAEEIKTFAQTLAAAK
jgi:anti-sigma factor RsiW